MFCLRRFFLRLGALLFSIPFSFRDGSPDISNGTCLFFFRCPHRYFGLRCSYPLYCFADASPGKGAFPAVATDLVTITRTMLIQKRTLLALLCIRCISTNPMLYLNTPNTLYRHCVPVAMPRQKISVRPCASCRHYTIVFVRTCKYDKMWLVGLRVLP